MAGHPRRIIITRAARTTPEGHPRPTTTTIVGKVMTTVSKK